MPIPEIQQARHLAKQVDALERQLAELQKQHGRLQLEHTLLTAMSDNLGWLRDRHVEELQVEESQQQQQQQSEGLPTQHSGCTDDGNDYLSELLLLEELGGPQKASPEPDSQDNQFSACTVVRQHSGSMSSTCSSSIHSLMLTAADANPAASNGSIWANAVPDGFVPVASPHASPAPAEKESPAVEAEQRLASADDMLMQFRWLLSRPNRPAAREPTLQQLQSMYMLSVHEMSLLLSLLENPFICDTATNATQNPAAALKAVVQRYFSTVATLGLQGQGHLLSLFHATNLLTGDVQSGDVTCDWQQLVWAVKKAGISPEQLKQIAAGYALGERLLAPVLEESQSLLVEVAEGLKESCYGSLTTGSHDLDQKVTRLNLILRKQYFLQVCFGTFTLGCLSPLQVAKLAVAIFPYPLNLTAVEYVADQLVKKGSTGP